MDNTQLVALIDQLSQQIEMRIQADTQAEANGQGSSAEITALQDLETCLTGARSILAGSASTPSAAPSAAPLTTPSPTPSVTTPVP
jgi:hypothetical protein